MTAAFAIFPYRTTILESRRALSSEARVLGCLQDYDSHQASRPKATMPESF